MAKRSRRSRAPAAPSSRHHATDAQRAVLDWTIAYGHARPRELVRLADCPEEIFALLAAATDDPQGLVGIAALALSVPTDPALNAGREPSDDELISVLHCFRWHVALESLRRQGLVTVDAISGAIFDPACRVRVRLQDPVTGGWQVGEVMTGESVAETASRVAAVGLAEHAAGVQSLLSPRN